MHALELADAMLFLSTLSLRRATTSIAGRITSNGTFLSTLSLRRATGGERANQSEHCISIHALLAESDRAARCTWRSGAISIHALLAESDLACGWFCLTPERFLSTLSLRRATAWRSTRLLSMIFLSTLSLRRATTVLHQHGRGHRDFYPRSPCGERQRNRCPIVLPSLISIHALLAESDRRKGANNTSF